MSCNPAIGGLAKGHLVREIDALGGAMGRVADACGIQFRLLNRSRGPGGARPPRSRTRSSITTRCRRSFAGSEPDAPRRRGRGTRRRRWACVGVRMAHGSTIGATTVVVTTGTFLRGLMHLGLDHTPGGRVGEAPANACPQRSPSWGFGWAGSRPARPHVSSVRASTSRDSKCSPETWSRRSSRNTPRASRCHRSPAISRTRTKRFTVSREKP